MANTTGKKFGGRSKGTPNRSTEEIRQSLLKLLDDNLINLQNDIDGMTGKDRATILINLARHCTPPAVVPDKLTESQILEIIEYIKDHEKNI
jgi:hypothetical protein